MTTTVRLHNHSPLRSANPRAGDDYIDYDSDYDAKAEAGRAPAVNVDPYAGMLPIYRPFLHT
jgi:hypothetical protein